MVVKVFYEDKDDKVFDNVETVCCYSNKTVMLKIRNKNFCPVECIYLHEGTIVKVCDSQK